MAEIGRTEQPVVVRTDFSDETGWLTLRDELLAESPEGWKANVNIVDDPGFDGCAADRVLGAVTEDYRFSFLGLVDAVAVGAGVHAVLVVDLLHEPGRSFCAAPGEVQSVENNLSLANMDFFEFAESVGPDDVFRGFA